MRNVKPDPSSVHPFRYRNCGPAPAERVKQNVALVGACRDDPLQKSLWFLRRVPKTFLSLRINRWDVGPNRTHYTAGHLAQVAFQLRTPSRVWRAVVVGGIPNPPISVKLSHGLARIPPALFWPVKPSPFVHHVWARAWTGHVVEPIFSAVAVVVPILGINVALTVRISRRVPNKAGLGIPSIEEKAIGNPARS